MPSVLLINTNTMRPPVAPIGLDYLASSFDRTGIEPVLLDLAFVKSPQIADEIARAIRRHTPDVIGCTVRNTDDCSMATRAFFMPQIRALVIAIKKHTDAPIVLGGVGYSIFPREILDFVPADFGIAGDGELAFVQLVDALVLKKEREGISGLAWRRDGEEVVINPPEPVDTVARPYPSREFVDNGRYMREGGMIGFETKRGCGAQCIYCADPAAKGRVVRCRPPRIVAEEIRNLLNRGADVLHTCDSEFNLPAAHGLEVCNAIREAGLGDRIQWYAYCAPAGFDKQTALLYRRAGCRGINFGCDSGSDKMLARLGRTHRREDILQAVEATKSVGMSCMIDMLLGAPGESLATIRETVESGRTSGADRVGLSIGVRIYPRTPLARALFRRHRGTRSERDTEETQPDLLQPQFFTEPALGESIREFVREQVGGDPRFLFLDPAQTGANYNYNDNTALVKAIAKGYRGAFWDILRRVAEGLPPD